LIVAINKLDVVEWKKSRYDEIVKVLVTFLRQNGFKVETQEGRRSNVVFLPCSGLTGQNIRKLDDPRAGESQILMCFHFLN
jgi:elongation factor 1 alpha-like protein